MYRALLDQLPLLDLRALMLAAIAVTPLYLWYVAASVFDIVYAYDPMSEAFYLAYYAFKLITRILGGVIVALGVAIMLKNGSIHPFSLALTSLLAMAVLEADYYAIVWLNTSMGLTPSTADSSERIFDVLRSSSALVGIVLAARLYATWQRPSTDRLDARRFAVLVAVAFCFGVWNTASEVSLLASIETIPTTVLAVWATLYFVWSTGGHVGAVFLFGSLAIAWTRYARLEHKFSAVAFSAVAAAVVYLLVEGGGQQIYFALMEPTAFAQQTVLLVERMTDTVVPYLSIVIAGAALYMASADDGFVRRLAARIRNLPAAVRAARSWPHRPAEDEER